MKPESDGHLTLSCWLNYSVRVIEPSSQVQPTDSDPDCPKCNSRLCGFEYLMKDSIEGVRAGCRPSSILPESLHLKAELEL